MTPFRQGIAAMQMQSPAPLLAKQSLSSRSVAEEQDENAFNINNSNGNFNKFSGKPSELPQPLRKRSNLTEFVVPAPRDKPAFTSSFNEAETPMFAKHDSGIVEKFLEDETPVKFSSAADPVTVTQQSKGYASSHGRHDSNSMDGLPVFQQAASYDEDQNNNDFDEYIHSNHHVQEDDEKEFAEECQNVQQYEYEEPAAAPVLRKRASLYLRRAVGVLVALSVFVSVFAGSFYSILFVWNNAGPLVQQAYVNLIETADWSKFYTAPVVVVDEFVPASPHPGITVDSSIDDIAAEDPVKEVEIFAEPVVSLTERLQTIELALSQLSQNLEQANAAAHSDQQMMQKMKVVVEEALGDYHRQQVVGYADYAFEKTGGKIVHSMTSKTFDPQSSLRQEQPPTSFLSSLFGSSSANKKPQPVKRSHSNTPETAIRESVVPGSCWPFEGSSGQLTVQLAREIIPTNFTVEHILPVQALNNDVSSAPKRFRILSLASDMQESSVLGEYEYDTAAPYGKQTFIVQSPSFSPIKHVQLQILSNHGNAQYTCLYRFQVHGFMST